MSPTAAILMRIERLSGAGGGNGLLTGAGCGSVAGSGGGGGGRSAGVVVHADSNNATTGRYRPQPLVTEAYPHNVDFRCAKSAASNVQLIEIVDGPYVNAIVVTIVYAGSLYS